MDPSCPLHQQAVDSITAALVGEAMRDNSGSDDFSEEEDDEMSDDDEVDDLMTLDQFKEEAHRESHIRKGIHEGIVTQKKGRIDQGGSCP